MESFSQEITALLEEFYRSILGFIPDLLALIVIIISGVIISLIFKFLTYRALHVLKFDSWSEHIGIRSMFEKAEIEKTPSKLASSIVYYLLLMLFIMTGLSKLHISGVDAFISSFLIYLPRFFSALAVLVLGYLFAGFLSRAALLAAVNLGVAYAKPISELIRVFFLIFVFAMALEQLAIATRIVVTAFTLLFGAVALGLALAFGLGGRDAAGKIIESMSEEKKKNMDDIEPL